MLSMKNKSYIVCIITACLFTSCNKKAEERNIEFLEKDTAYLLENMYTPRDICCIDSFLVVGDHNNSDAMYFIFKREGNGLNLLSSYGNRGEGPDEFIFPESIKIRGESITIFDRSLVRMKEIFFPLSENNKIENIHNITNKLFVGLNNVIKMNDDLFVGLTYLDIGRLAIVNKDVLYPVDIAYPDDEVPAPARQKSLVYQGTLLKHPSLDKFVYASFYGKILEIYELDRNENSMHRAVCKYELFPEYTSVDGREIIEANFTSNNVTGYLCASVSNRYIYLLYSGKTVKDKNKNFSSRIDVYNWEGIFVKTLMLDQEVAAFCVNAEDNVMYSVRCDEVDEKTMLYCYNLSW